MSERLFRRGSTWYCWYYTRDGHRVKESTKCTDRRAAASFLRQREREAQDPDSYHPASQTPYLLSKALDDIVNEDTSGRAPATLGMYAKKGGVLLRILGDVDITTLHLVDVEAYVKARLGEEVAPDRTVSRETVRKELVTLRRVLHVASKRGRIRYDPRTVIPEFRTRYTPRDRYLTEAEFSALLQALPAKRQRWLMLAIYTGGRHSEIEAIHWEHIDWAQGRVLLPGTKTAKARRRIPLADPLRAVLKPLKESRGPVVEPWRNVRRDLALYCDQDHANIPAVSPNDLRRTYASWLKQRGVDSMVVAQLLGHSSTRMVELVYGHLNSDVLDRAVAKLPAPMGARRQLSQMRPTGKRSQSKVARYQMVATR